MSSVLTRGTADLVGGQWRDLTGDGIVSVNPARPGEEIWRGSANVGHVDAAVAAARAAQREWAAWPQEKRFDALRVYRDLCKARKDEIAALICRETSRYRQSCLMRTRKARQARCTSSRAESSTSYG